MLTCSFTFVVNSEVVQREPNEVEFVLRTPWSRQWSLLFIHSWVQLFQRIWRIQRIWVDCFNRRRSGSCRHFSSSLSCEQNPDVTTAEERAIFGFTVVDWMLAIVQLIKRLDPNVSGYKGDALTPHSYFFSRRPSNKPKIYSQTVKVELCPPTSTWMMIQLQMCNSDGNVTQITQFKCIQWYISLK